MAVPQAARSAGISGLLLGLALAAGPGPAAADIAAVGAVTTSTDLSQPQAGGGGTTTWNDEVHDVLGLANVNLGQSVGTTTHTSIGTFLTGDPPTGSVSLSATSAPGVLDYASSQGSFVCADSLCSFVSVTYPLDTISGSAVGTDPGDLPDAGVSYVLDSSGTCVLTGNLFECSGQSVINAVPILSTPAGANVTVAVDTTYLNPITGTEEALTIDVTYDSVATAGTTTIQPLASADGPVPANLAVAVGGYQALFFDVTSDASFSGDVAICGDIQDADNDGLVDDTTVDECDLRLLHRESGSFVDRTTLGAACPLPSAALTCPGASGPGSEPCIDTLANRICAQVSSFSPFAVAVQTGPPPAVPALGALGLAVNAGILGLLGAAAARRRSGARS